MKTMEKLAEVTKKATIELDGERAQAMLDYAKQEEAKDRIRTRYNRGLIGGTLGGVLGMGSGAMLGGALLSPGVGGRMAPIVPITAAALSTGIGALIGNRVGVSSANKDMDEMYGKAAEEHQLKKLTETYMKIGMVMEETVIKEAALQSEDIVNNLINRGATVNQDDLAAIQNLLEQERAKSFAMRHPFITGLPTLGIWPSVANANAENRIDTNILLRRPELMQEIRAQQLKDQQHEKELYALGTERDRANQFSNAVSAAAMPLMAYNYSRNQD